MNCCNAYGQCTQGNNCPARSTPLNRANGGRVVDTTMDDQKTDQRLDLLDKVIWGAFLVGFGGFWVLTIIQVARWLNS